MGGIFGFFDYDKPGKGVPEDGRPEKPFTVFRNVFVRKFWKMVQLNILYVFAVIPSYLILAWLINVLSYPLFIRLRGAIGSLSVATTEEELISFFGTFNMVMPLIVIILWGAGPVTAGFAYILRCFSEEKHAWILSEFWEHTKKNFKQCLLIFAIDIVVIFCFAIAFSYYYSMSGFYLFPAYLLVVLLAVYTMMHPYIYLMTITFKLPIRGIFKNSMLLSIGTLPQSVLVLVVTLAVTYVFFMFKGFMLITVPLLIFFITWYIQIFWTYQVIRKHMLENVSTNNKH